MLVQTLGTQGGIHDLINVEKGFKNDMEMLPKVLITDSYMVLIPYSGKLSMEKTFVNGGKLEIRGENFRGSLRYSLIMNGCGRRFSRVKTFADSRKTTKFVKVFSLESSPLYSMQANGLYHYNNIMHC